MIPSTSPAPPLHVVVLIPLRNDWDSARELLHLLDQAICSYPCTVDVLLVDDGSVQDFHSADFQSRFAVLRTIQILRLRRNLGHQRAIAIGFVHVERFMLCDAVLVMDGDGEDTPGGALELLRAFSGTAIFAERSRRSESLVFQLFYQLYKLLHRILTGISVRVGNFSILPSRYLGTLVVMSELWNHYAAAVFRSGLPFTTIPIPRGNRITGTSKMNFVSLAIQWNECNFGIWGCARRAASDRIHGRLTHGRPRHSCRHCDQVLHRPGRFRAGPLIPSEFWQSSSFSSSPSQPFSLSLCFPIEQTSALCRSVTTIICGRIQGDLPQ